MSIPSIQQIADYSAKWADYQKDDPKKFAEKFANSWIILAIPGDDWTFVPLRHVLTAIEGVPFSYSGRSLNIQKIAPDLIALGLARVSYSSPFFDYFYDRYATACETLGKKPGKVEEPSPKTKREFWVAPAPFPSA